MTTYHCDRCNVEHVRLQQAVPDKPEGWGRQLIVDFAVALLVIAAVVTSLLYAGTR